MFEAWCELAVSQEELTYVADKKKKIVPVLFDLDGVNHVVSRPDDFPEADIDQRQKKLVLC